MLKFNKNDWPCHSFLDLISKPYWFVGIVNIENNTGIHPVNIVINFFALSICKATDILVMYLELPSNIEYKKKKTTTFNYLFADKNNYKPLFSYLVFYLFQVGISNMRLIIMLKKKVIIAIFVYATMCNTYYIII